MYVVCLLFYAIGGNIILLFICFLHYLHHFGRILTHSDAA